MPQIIPTAESFFFPGSHTGCLLIHGFTGTPKEMRWMGEYLAARGLSVLGVRLAGHATRPQDITRVHWTDWAASVEDGYHLLRGLADHIYLVGLSMGGVLALLMSTRLDVRGVVAMSTPWRVAAGSLAKSLRPFSAIWPYAPPGKPPPNDGWFDLEALKDHICYDRTSIAAAAEFESLLEEFHSALLQVRVPVLLIQSQDDATVVPSDVDAIYAALPGVIGKTKVLVKNSGHVVTRDAAREQVFEAAAQFILRLESEAG